MLTAQARPSRPHPRRLRHARRPGETAPGRPLRRMGVVASRSASRLDPAGPAARFSGPQPKEPRFGSGSTRASCEPDLGRRSMHPCEAGDGVEDAFAGAPGDVLLEPGREEVAGALARPEAFLGRVERAREPDRGDGRVGPRRRRAPRRSGPRRRRRRSRTRPSTPAQKIATSSPAFACRSDDRVEVDEARGEHPLAARGRGHERPRPVRRRQDDRVSPATSGTRAASSRGRSPGSGRSAARPRAARRRAPRAAPAPPRPPRSRGRGR